MKILITGGSGYIGSNLISELQKHTGFFIYALVRKSTTECPVYHNVDYIQCDLSGENFISYLPSGIDVVIHLAQSNYYREFPEKSDDIYQINVHATHQLLEWARKKAVKKFIYSSSGNVYKRENRKLVETDLCIPLDYYGTSKLISELLIKNYAPYFSIKILRIFGVYGPRQTGMLVANIINKVRSSQIITLARGCGVVFSPLYIEDCTEMIRKILNDGSEQTIYNICGGEVVTLGDMLAVIGSALSIKPQIIITDEEPQYLIGSSSLFAQSFGYKYRFNIVSGLKKTING